MATPQSNQWASHQPWAPTLPARAPKMFAHTHLLHKHTIKWSTIICCIVSAHWSQKGHAGWLGSPRRTSRSDIYPYLHAKNLSAAGRHPPGPNLLSPVLIVKNRLHKLSAPKKLRCLPTWTRSSWTSGAVYPIAFREMLSFLNHILALV